MISKIIVFLLIGFFFVSLWQNVLYKLTTKPTVNITFKLCEPGEGKGECLNCSVTGLAFLPNDTICRIKYGLSFICASIGKCINTSCNCFPWEDCVYTYGAVPTCVLKPNTCYKDRNCTIRVRAKINKNDWQERSKLAGYLVAIYRGSKNYVALKVPCYWNKSLELPCNKEICETFYDCRFDPTKANLHVGEYEAYFFWRNGIEQLTFYIVPNPLAKNFYEVEVVFGKLKNLRAYVKGVETKQGKWRGAYYDESLGTCRNKDFIEWHKTYSQVRFNLAGPVGKFLVCFEFIDPITFQPASTIWSVMLPRLKELRTKLGSFYEGSNIYVYNCFEINKEEDSWESWLRPVVVYEEYDAVNVTWDDEGWSSKEIERNVPVDLSFVIFNFTDNELNPYEDLIYASSPKEAVRSSIACTSYYEYTCCNICDITVPVCCVKGCNAVEICENLNNDETFPTTCVDRQAEMEGRPKQLGCNKCVRTCFKLCNNFPNCNNCDEENSNSCSERPCSSGIIDLLIWAERCVCDDPYKAWEDCCIWGGEEWIFDSSCEQKSWFSCSGECCQEVKKGCMACCKKCGS